jgi:alpha-1,2-mannosyltransferase
MRAGVRRNGLAPAYLALAALLSLYSWALFALSFHHDGLLPPRFNAPGIDYMVFYTAARDVLRGDEAGLWDAAAFTARLNHDFARWLTAPLPPHPWVYPPPFLLLLLPFARLSFAASYAAFMLATLAAAACGAWVAAGGPRMRVAWLLVLGFAPATAIDMIAGQNALLTAAILLGGLGVLERRPFLGGMILGAMIYKPQFAPMIPVALAARADRRALLGAGMGASALAIGSAAVLGLSVWRDSLHWALHGGAAFATWVRAGRLLGVSVYAGAARLGAPAPVAQGLQAIAAVGAAACVFAAFRRPLPRPRRHAVLLAATVLAAPHVSPYDTVLLAGAALLLLEAEAGGTGAALPPILPFLLWAAPFFGPSRLMITGCAVPLLAIGAIVQAWRPFAGRACRLPALP